MKYAKGIFCGALSFALGASYGMENQAGGAGWFPAPVPLKTVWGEKVTPENAWREYPRPQMVRDGWVNLNGLWDYAVTKDAPEVPRTWDERILVPFAIESSLSGVGRLLEPGEILWYRRTIDGTRKPGERLLLNFDAVDFRTQVFVNGREVTDVPHEGGQLPFTLDITDFVSGASNELVVCTWDPTEDFVNSRGKQSFRPGGCFYTRVSGIWQTVWLERVPETYIEDYRVTTDIDAGTVTFRFDVKSPKFAKPEVEVTVAGLQGRTENGALVVKMPAGFKLWSPEEPNLYGFTATCGEDRVDGYFGMRKFDMAPDAKGVLRFRLNNKFRYILGTLDQGLWPDGLLTPPSEEAMAWDVKLLKDAGFDMMRKHIKVEPRRYYALCDRLGILVIQDMPSGTGDAEARYGLYRRELKEMMDRLYNAPSVVMWIPYNESCGQPGPVQTRNTLLWMKRHDPTRLVDGPSGWHDWEGGDRGMGWANGEWNTSRHRPPEEEESGDVVDRHDYREKPEMLPVNPRRASFLGEFGGLGCRVAGHLWTANAWGYGDTGKDADRKAFETKYVNLMDHVGGLAAKGLAGSVYTQTTDVEGEINGLVTYDRKVVKFDPAVFAEAHRRVREVAEKASRADLQF